MWFLSLLIILPLKSTLISPSEIAPDISLRALNDDKKDTKETLISLQKQLAVQQAELRSLSQFISEKHSVLQEDLYKVQLENEQAQWSMLQLSALSMCTNFHPPTTKTLFPFIQGVSCAEVCEQSNTRFNMCLAVVRVYLEGKGRAKSANAALGHTWARTESCHSRRYSLGSEMDMMEPSGHYTACCCGYWSGQVRVVLSGYLWYGTSKYYVAMVNYQIA